MLFNSLNFLLFFPVVCIIYFAIPALKWRNLLLSVGISFYTFQALGYSIDVYRRQTAVEKNFFTYALFVSFFPQLVADPIYLLPILTV